MINLWEKVAEKRVKPILWVQLTGGLFILLILANNFLNEFSLVQFKVLFWILALVSFALAIEDVLLKKQKSIYMFKFSTTFVYLMFPFFFLN